ncbi:MAG: DUF2203 family protein [Planctomycetota bacterium]
MRLQYQSDDHFGGGWMVDAVNDSDNQLDGEVKFSLASAIRAIPLVRRIVDDLTDREETLRRHQEQVNNLVLMGPLSDRPELSSEVTDIIDSLAVTEQDCLDCRNELTRLGVKLHADDSGYVDFPVQLDRQSIMLCWHPDQSGFTHWHADSDHPPRLRPLSDLMLPGGCA